MVAQANIHGNILVPTCLDKHGIFLMMSFILCRIHGQYQRLGFSHFLANPVMSYSSLPFNKQSSSRCEQMMFLPLSSIERVKHLNHLALEL